MQNTPVSRFDFTLPMIAQPSGIFPLPSKESEAREQRRRRAERARQRREAPRSKLNELSTEFVANREAMATAFRQRS